MSEKWISVLQAMPQDTKAVLVWCPELRNKYTAFWCNSEWCHFAPGTRLLNEEVSHWMPTPDGPAPYLRPCPFCGERASSEGVIRYSSNPNTHWKDGTEVLEAFYCNCMSCGAKMGGACTGGYQTRAEAIQKWNTRVVPPESSRGAGTE
jgi:hypothetical protein